MREADARVFTARFEAAGVVIAARSDEIAPIQSLHARLPAQSRCSDTLPPVLNFEFWTWNFLGFWCLEFGISAQLPSHLRPGLFFMIQVPALGDGEDESQANEDADHATRQSQDR
jgi:hypothetical protein